MSATIKTPLPTAAAESYETQKVPSLFRPLAQATLDTIALPENARVIDIACGTGIVSKLVAERLPGRGRIVGVDHAAAMIEVAKRGMPSGPHKVDWVVSDVTDLPFETGTFDLAFLQQGLQFFPDKPKALAEIRRVLRPGGMLYLTCWRTISPLLLAVAESVKRRVGDEAAGAAVKPFSFRDAELIGSLLRDAGFTVEKTSRLVVHRHLDSVRPAISEEILGHPIDLGLRDRSDGALEAVVADVDAALVEYRRGDGLVFPQEANLFHAANPAG